MENCAAKLPLGWISARLGDLCEFEYGKSLTKGARSGGTYPVFGSSGIVGLHNQFLVEGPAIIVGRKGAAGAVHYSTDPCWPIDTTYFVRDGKNLHGKFSYYLLRSLNLEKLEASTAIPGLNRNHAYDETVLLPPLAEQHRIVAKIEELFSELDKGIESLKTAQAQLKVYRQALLKHAFEGKLTAKWRANNPDKLETADALLKRIQKEREQRYHQQLADWEAAGKQGRIPKAPEPLVSLNAEDLAELHVLPEGWIRVRLEGLITGVDQGWSPKCEGHPASDVEWGVIKTTAIQHGRFDSHENKALRHGMEPRTQHELRAGDILVTRAGPRVRVGVCCLIRVVRNKLMNCDKAYRIRAVDPICRSDYLEAVLNSPRTLDAIESIKSGINDSGVNLNQGAFLGLAIPFCCLDEQSILVQELELKLSEIAQLELTLSSSLQHAEALRQAILKKAFSGQLVPQDPADEPAARLLERIRAEREKTGSKKSGRSR